MNPCLLAGLALAALGPFAAFAPLPARADDGGGAPGAPLPVANLAPVTRLYGLPQPLGPVAVPGTAQVSFTVAHANNFTAEAGEGTAAVFDGSTTVASLALRRPWRESWEWGLEVPLVDHGGGFTDGFIENYHDLFGFPDGDRRAVPRNRLDYRVMDGGDLVAEVSGGGRHLGDARAWVGYRLLRAPGRQAALRAMVELPTGAVDNLSGSESTDVSVWVEMADERWLAAVNTTVTLGVGVAVPGKGDLLTSHQRDAVFTGHLGLHVPVTARLVLTAQLDGHTDVLDTGLEPLGEGALLGTLGGTVALSRSLRLDLGLVEDLTPDHAPDVVLLLALRARL